MHIGRMTKHTYTFSDNILIRNLTKYLYLPISIQRDRGICEKSKHQANSSPLVTV